MQRLESKEIQQVFPAIPTSDYRDEILDAFEAAHAVPIEQRLEAFKCGIDMHGEIWYFLEAAIHNPNPDTKNRISAWIKKQYPSADEKEKEVKNPPLTAFFFTTVDSFTSVDYCILGMRRYYGFGVQQSYEDAKELFYKAKIHPLAKFYIGKLGPHGRREWQASTWYKAAAGQHCALATAHFAVCEDALNSPREEVSLLLKSAAEAGLGWAIYQFATYTKENEEKNLELAARQGIAEAVVKLAISDANKNGKQTTPRLIAYCTAASKYYVRSLETLGVFLCQDGPFQHKGQAAWCFRQVLRRADVSWYNQAFKDLEKLLSQNHNQNPAIYYNAGIGFANLLGRGKYLVPFNELCKTDLETFYKLFRDSGDRLEIVEPLLSQENMQRLAERIDRPFALKKCFQNSLPFSADIAGIIAEYEVASYAPSAAPQEDIAITHVLCYEQKIWDNAKPKSLFARFFNYSIFHDGQIRQVSKEQKNEWDEIQAAKCHQQSFMQCLEHLGRKP